jgi:hypothetical protein
MLDNFLKDFLFLFCRLMFRGQVSSQKAFGDSLEYKIRQISFNYTKYSIEFADCELIEANVSVSPTNNRKYGYLISIFHQMTAAVQTNFYAVGL